MDESGFMLQRLARRTWAPRGCTPVHDCWDRRDRASVITALRLSPRCRRIEMFFDLLDHNVRAVDFEAFVASLRRRFPRGIILVLDRYAPPSQTAPDFKGAIGVTADSVEGVDIAVPVYHFSETHYLDATLVTEPYKATLFALTGRVNSGAFKGLAAGECLFLGAAGTKRGQGDWEITFRFAASPNVTGLTIGDITGIAKKGWEYLWVRYADAEDAAAKALVKRPIAVYIEKVYADGDFSLLGI